MGPLRIDGMQTVLIVLAAVHVVGVVIVLVASAKAPFGYEDDRGFHKHESEAPASSQTAA